jgi:SOS response associated peptidase (SRAP)
MCGRYKLELPFREIVRLYNLTQANASRFDNMPARYNIAPTQDVAVVRLNRETKERELVMLRWGLIPYWAKDVKIAFSTINAKCESIADKPAFKEAFAEQRPCGLTDREPSESGPASCIWCGRSFALRRTGGSAQKFCSTVHRQAFWTAARRWTIRAIEAGLLSIDSLKAAQSSVQAEIDERAR